LIGKRGEFNFVVFSFDGVAVFFGYFDIPRFGWRLARRKREVTLIYLLASTCKMDRTTLAAPALAFYFDYSNFTSTRLSFLFHTRPSLFWLSFSWANKFVFLLMAKERRDLLTLKEFRTRLCVCVHKSPACEVGPRGWKWAVATKGGNGDEVNSSKREEKEKEKRGKTESKSLRLEMKGNRCV
jgi:hypothetical protein